MKVQRIIVLLAFALVCCAENKSAEQQPAIPLEGTWQLISGTTIQKGDTTITDYTQTLSMIKVINPTHFAFLKHDLNGGKDSTAMFGAGGGLYELKGDQYTEHLAYCDGREWEGHTFVFTVKIDNDTLMQSGVEKNEDIGVDRIIIERYVRIHPR